MLRVASVCTPCCMLLRVAQSLKPVKLLATWKRTQQLTALLGQQCWELLRPFTPGFKQQIPQATIAQSQFKVYDGIFANSCPASRTRYFARSQICLVTCSERNKESFSLGYGLLVHATRSSGTSRTGLTWMTEKIKLHVPNHLLPWLTLLAEKLAGEHR